jgi:hypothetical protein
MFQIFSLIVETVKDPMFAPIAFDWDLDRRSARVDIPGVVAPDGAAKPVVGVVVLVVGSLVVVLEVGVVVVRGGRLVVCVVVDSVVFLVGEFRVLFWVLFW